MKIYIGADHRGVELKNQIVKYLKEENFDVEESSIQNTELDDYPDFAFDIAKKVIKNNNSFGILICGNGIGMSIAANKVKGIRCARVVDLEDVKTSRNDDGINMLALGILPLSKIKQMIDLFITTPPAPLERFQRRIEKINKYETENFK